MNISLTYRSSVALITNNEHQYEKNKHRKDFLWAWLTVMMFTSNRAHTHTQRKCPKILYLHWLSAHCSLVDWIGLFWLTWVSVRLQDQAVWGKCVGSTLTPWLNDSASFRGAGAYSEELKWFLTLTLRLAGSAHGVHLIAWVTLTLKVSFEVDADLTAGIRVLTLVNVCDTHKTIYKTIIKQKTLMNIYEYIQYPCSIFNHSTSKTV